MVMSQVASAKLGGLQTLPIQTKFNKLAGTGVASSLLQDEFGARVARVP